MTRPRILLVSPPIYDFAAYGFWLRPYGLLSVAGQLRGQADFTLFDFLDRQHPSLGASPQSESDRWGRGRFRSERVGKPACLDPIPRYFQRFGLPRDRFQKFLASQSAFDFALVQTVMSYWYPGVQEVIEDVRRVCPTAKIVLGGNYVTICPAHAATLGADLCVVGTDLDPLWRFLGIEPDAGQTGLWEMYHRPTVGALKLSDGCPFHCTYCSVPSVYKGFRLRPLERSLAELELLVSLGVRDVAFYDDALLFDTDAVLVPFLEEVMRRNIQVHFHTPNALNARFIQADLAKLMVQAGFRTFYLGFESHSQQWQQGTGGKVYSDELARAVRHLIAAGADPLEVTAYQIVGHPNSDLQELEASMHFVRSLGIRGMLADFSPIPGTPDGEACRRWVDLDEPLMHNKTAFPIFRLGFDEVNRLKDLQRQLNRTL
ncbi:MAG TPA: radical SAM protein [Sedimentisphaerales bacterium]|nr:radical SAM protein [Sedimentisphaerales bacterium]HRS10141.1 radical SAM protein [Sedimentisphaerales bacterium]HRV46847.1 radical SAM protein [Sedimentisphaerales bacterium]